VRRRAPAAAGLDPESFAGRSLRAAPAHAAHRSRWSLPRWETDRASRACSSLRPPPRRGRRTALRLRAPTRTARARPPACPRITAAGHAAWCEIWRSRHPKRKIPQARFRGARPMRPRPTSLAEPCGGLSREVSRPLPRTARRRRDRLDGPRPPGAVWV
jgi:hypothetical protein